MAVVGVEGTDVLQEDNLSPGCKHRRENDGQDTIPIGLNPGDARDMAILTYSSEILTELGFEEGPDGDRQQSNDQKGDNGDLGKPVLHSPNIVQNSPHPRQVHRVSQTGTGGDPQSGVIKGNESTHQEQKDKLIHTIGKKAHDHTGDHLPALGLVENQTRQGSKKHSQRSCQKSC